LFKRNLQQQFKITAHDFTNHLRIRIEKLKTSLVRLHQRDLPGALFDENPPNRKKLINLKLWELIQMTWMIKEKNLWAMWIFVFTLDVELYSP
jgi:hypothetical protein